MNGADVNGGSPDPQMILEVWGGQHKQLATVVARRGANCHAVKLSKLDPVSRAVAGGRFKIGSQCLLKMCTTFGPEDVKKLLVADLLTGAWGCPLTECAPNLAHT